MAVKYPNVTVNLSDEDGNAMFIMARVTGAMKRAGISKDERAAFTREATSGDYGHVLRTVMNWVTTE